jgi:hypothetical protein
MKSYENLSPQTPEWVHINATETLSLRLTPQIRQSIEGIALAQNKSLTQVALSAFNLLFFAKNKPQGEDLLYW